MNIYYVDSCQGCDSADGLTKETAWKTLGRVNEHTEFQPGDTLLLKRGCVWIGETLCPKGEGTAEAPICVDSYGEGDLPLIDRRGRVDDTENGTVAVSLVNQSYWQIRRIAISNRNPDLSGRVEDPKLREDGGYDFPRRSGLSIVSRWQEGVERTVVRGILVEDVVVRDVEGSNGDEGNCYYWAITGGKWRGSSGSSAISISCVDSPDGCWRAHTENVLVQSCSVHNCSGTCVAIGSSAWKYHDSHVNTVIRNNRVTCDANVERSPAGAYIVSAKNPLIEYNYFCNLSNGIAFQVCDGGICRRNTVDTMHGRMVLCSRLAKKPMYWDGTGYDVDSGCIGQFHLYENIAISCAEGSFSMFDLSKGGSAQVSVENNMSINSEHFFYHQLGFTEYRLTFRNNTVIRSTNRVRERANHPNDMRLFYTMHQTPKVNTYLFEDNRFYYPEQTVSWDMSGAVRYVNNLYVGNGDVLPDGVSFVQ